MADLKGLCDIGAFGHLDPLGATRMPSDKVLQVVQVISNPPQIGSNVIFLSF